MYYVYVLKSLKSGRNYTGLTSNLGRRFKEHNEKSGGHYSSRNAPFILMYYEAFLDKRDASSQERFYKTGYGREVLKGKLKNYLNLTDQPLRLVRR